MPIKTKITKKEYINLSLFLIFNNIGVKILIGICLLGSVGTTIFLTAMGTYKLDIFDIIKPALIFFLMFFFFWNAIRKAYNTNKRLGETIEYRFDDDFLIIKGESFSGQVTWDTIHKVTQTDKWLLIYQTRNSANFISKKDISEGDIALLKNILNTHKVKNTL